MEEAGVLEVVVGEVKVEQGWERREVLEFCEQVVGEVERIEHWKLG